MRVRSSHVSPPFVDRKIPLPGPPLVKLHGCRSVSHAAAYRTRGLPGSMHRSAAPARSPRSSTRSQLSPPSVVRNTPRSSLGPNACPSAATYATSGSDGCIRTLAMCLVSRSPTFRQVRPPSVDRYTPSPCDTLPLMQASPVPAYTTLGSDCDTAIAPTDAVPK